MIRKLLLGLLASSLLVAPGYATDRKPVVIVSNQVRQLPSGDTLIVNDDAYDATSWNSSTGVPTKNAVRDKIESVIAGGSGGTVTTVSVVSTNGFAGSVATATSTPAITLTTTITGILKGNGTAISSATAGTDYLAPAAIGSTVQAYDADLGALGGVTSAADKCPYFTGSGTASVVTCSSAGRTLMTNGYTTESLCFALSDETTALTTGTAKVTFRMPYAFTVTAVRGSVNTVSSSGLPTVDINEGGSTILSTKLTIDASELTSTTAAAAAVISDASLADDAEITFDQDVAGTGAKGQKVCIIGHQ